MDLHLSRMIAVVNYNKDAQYEHNKITDNTLSPFRGWSSDWSMSIGFWVFKTIKQITNHEREYKPDHLLIDRRSPEVHRTRHVRCSIPVCVKKLR